jgi:hypothetical protein
MGLAGTVYMIKFVRDTQAALALRDQPRQPWDVH